MMTVFTRIVLKYPVRVAFFGTLLGLVCTYFSALLYMNLRPDIEELLPTTSRSVLDLDQLTARLGSFENMVVLTFSEDREASKRFVDDLATALQTVPKDTIARIEYRIDKEVQFFKDRQALYLGVDDLQRVNEYVGKRIVYEKTIRNPVRLFPLEDIIEPKFDFESLKKGRASDVASFTKFKDGYYATDEDRVRAIVVYMPKKGLHSAHRMKDAIVEKVASLNPTSYAADLQVKYTGNVQNLIEESAALIADLEFSTVVCAFFIFLSLFLFFRSNVAATALTFSVVMGTLWTFGLCYFLVGYLNANTAFLASIVLGNGINFGIMFLSRYLEERRAGQSMEEAISIAMKMSSAATATAALAAGLSYASLMLTTFRGFSQFGVIGLVGMILCWMSAYTVLPAYLILLEKRIARDLHKVGKRKPFMDRVAALVEKRASAICFCVVLASLVSLATFRNYNNDLIENDLNKLRDRHSMTVGSGALYHYIDDIFGRSASPLLVLPTERKDAATIASLLREERTRQGSTSPITLVQTLDDFIPTEQAAKIAILREIEKKMDPKILRLAPLADQENVKKMLNPNVFKEFGEADLPALIRYKFSEVDGSLGKIVLVDKKIEKQDDTRALDLFVTSIRRVADSVVPGTPVAGEMAITYDMFQAIINDGPRVTFYSLVMVILLVALSFRNLKSTGLALFALALGMLWFVGIILGFRLRLNFLNFIAFPITFGIGVDYGVNMFQRFREDKNASILDIIRNAGGAVVLCSITTVIGYGSLLLAGNRAFVSFGTLAVAGETTCILAAVIALPAYLRLRTKRKAQSGKKGIELNPSESNESASAL
jgi:uncharacterized protein